MVGGMAVKPSLFVGSSSERLNVVTVVSEVLTDVCYAVGWRLANFIPGQATLQNLINAAEEYDFGLFIFGPDDVTESRDEIVPSTRDNVLFEYGLFLAAQGYDRTWAIVEKRNDAIPIKIPSDLEGIGMPRYDATSDLALRATLQGALAPIAREIKQKGRWHRRFGLRKSYGARPNKTVFVRLSAEKIRQRMHKFAGTQLCIIAHKEQAENIEDITTIVCSRPRKITSPNLNDDLVLETEPSPVLESLEDTDRLYIHTLLIPDRINILGCEAIQQMLDRGCELIDTVAVGKISW
jgi:hypothetical protein